MRTINHHLSDALLMGYSAGTLPEAFNLAVAAHVSMCDECRSRLESYDSVGGAVLERCGETDLAGDSLDATLALIAGHPADLAPPLPIVAAPDAVFPAPLRDYVGGDADAVSWKSVGGGVRQAVLATSKEATARLLYIPTGTAMPDHGHRGMELTLVLQGAFRDEHDYFGRGDIEIADEEMHHTPVAEGDEDCICLAVTDAPLRFNAILPRVAQRFIGI